MKPLFAPSSAEKPIFATFHSPPLNENDYFLRHYTPFKSFGLGKLEKCSSLTQVHTHTETPPIASYLSI